MLSNKIHSSTSYRPEIDGLRALAVLSVVFFHMDISLFSGGFIGVDIFFVISGYLISGIILKQLEEGEFSFQQFYLNRIKRIMPALYSMLAFVLVVSYLYYDTNTLKNIGKSISSIVLFVSNIVFSREEGYFAGETLFKPLMHTWSLAIEEQFYFVLPLFLFIIFKIAKKYINHLVLLFLLASLILNIIYINRNPSFTFYFLPTRAWELLFGTVLCLFKQEIVKRLGSISLLMQIASLFLIFIALFTFNEHTPFPGWYALLPVIGTTFLLCFCTADNGGIVYSMLSSRVFIFFGKISYSLYLWHWPLYSIGRYVNIKEFTQIEKCFYLLITVGISTLSWKYIELPIRYGFKQIKKKQMFAYAFVLSLLFCSIGAFIYIKKGILNRKYENSYLAHVENDSLWNLLGDAENQYLNTSTPILPIRIGDTTTESSFLLWGDSHARSLARGFSMYGNSKKKSGYVVNLSGVPPVYGIDNKNNLEPFFYNHNIQVVQFLKLHPEIKDVYLAGRWVKYYKTKENQKEFIKSNPQFYLYNSKYEEANSNAIFIKGFEKTIDTLLKLNKNIFILLNTPELNVDVKIIIAKYRWLQLNHVSEQNASEVLHNYMDTPAEYDTYNHEFLKQMTDLQKKYNSITLIDLQKALISDKRYIVRDKDGEFIYRDKDHLSKFGSLKVGEWLINNLK